MVSRVFFPETSAHYQDAKWHNIPEESNNIRKSCYETKVPETKLSLPGNILHES